MKDKINKYINDINNIIISDNSELQSFQNIYLSKKGVISNLFIEFKNIPNTEKKEIGQLLNKLKTIATQKLNSFTVKKKKTTKSPTLDFTMPSNYEKTGSKHPLTKVQNKIIIDKR